jgi:Fe-S cluster biogenesis protein NfuA
MSAEATSIEQRICAIIDELQPVIARDGGLIEFVSFVDGVVYVRLMGACTHCPMSVFTLKLGLQQKIAEQIPEVTSVQAVQ